MHHSFKNKAGNLIAFFLLLSFTAMAQPGGGGGIQIMNVLDDDGFLMDKNDTTLKVRYFILSQKKDNRVIREYSLSETDASYIQYSRNLNTRIYVPCNIGTGKKSKYYPNQRLQLVLKGDTMVIDFIGIMPENASGEMERIDRVGFQSGYFKCYRWASPIVAKHWKDSNVRRDELYRVLQMGLVSNSLYELAAYKLLEYVRDPHEYEKVVRKFRLRCRDTLQDVHTGYRTLCFNMISIKDTVVEITTNGQPLISDSVPCYKFTYFFQYNYSLGTDNYEHKLGDSILNDFKKYDLKINGQPFTGCLKLAIFFSKRGIRAYTGYDLMVQYYSNGRITAYKLLKDVELMNEQQGVERVH